MKRNSAPPPRQKQTSPLYRRLSALCRNTLFLLAVSGAAGFLAGAICYPGWHVAVETGQVLAGLIPYPDSNPYYIYHLKAWSITCQFSALLLKAGFPEPVPAQWLSGFLGMFFFQAMFFATYAVSRRVAISFATPFFLWCSMLLGFGISYPMLWLDCSDSFGSFGLFASVLALGLIGSARFRSGAFLLGLLPSIHGAYAVWMYAALGITALLDTRLLRRLLRYGLIPGAAGLALAALSFAWQHHLGRNIPYADPVAARDILIAFVRNADYHRRPFEYFHPGELVALFSAAAGAVMLFRTGRRDSRRTIPLFLILTFVMVNLAAVITHIDPKYIPSFALALMPGRFINLNNLLLAPLLIGLLGRGRGHPSGRIVLLAFVVLGITLRLMADFRTLPLLFGSLTFTQLQVTLFGATALAACAVLLSRRSATARERNASRKYYLAAALLPVLISIWPISKMVSQSEIRRRDIYTRQVNHPIIKAAAQRKGILLTSSGMRMIQLITRRPLLLEIDSFDGLPYAPGSAVPAAAILRDIYGVNLLEKQAPYILGDNAPFLKTHGPVWQNRSLREWQRIREEYGVTDILTVAELHLKLPVVIRDRQFTLYTIPPAL